MRRLAVALAALALVFAADVSAQQVTDEASVPRMSLSEFKKAWDAGAVLVLDVRDAGSYAEGHIPGAMLLPLDALQRKVAELKRARTLIVAYCS